MIKSIACQAVYLISHNGATSKHLIAEGKGLFITVVFTASETSRKHL